MTQQTILLADDDEMIVDALSFQLRREGYKVLAAFDGVEALELARQADPDLVLLDVMMPRMQGWEVCRELRKESMVPILMLTARGEEMDRVLGLELGADDYVVKPFSFRELLARVHAQLRRSEYMKRAGRSDDAVVGFGAVEIDRLRHVVKRSGEPVALSPREFELLVALADAGGAAVERATLLDNVWGEAWVGDPRTLDVHVRWLREKLEDNPSDPQWIVTVRGVGYRLRTQEEVDRNGR
ncbi:MAG: response regulator transcription factor [Caldilineaceae bacterium]